MVHQIVEEVMLLILYSWKTAISHWPCKKWSCSWWSSDGGWDGIRRSGAHAHGCRGARACDGTDPGWGRGGGHRVAVWRQQKALGYGGPSTHGHTGQAAVAAASTTKVTLKKEEENMKGINSHIIVQMYFMISNINAKFISMSLVVPSLSFYSPTSVIRPHREWTSAYPDKWFGRIWEICLNTASSVGLNTCTSYNVFTHCYSFCKKLSFV